jgi:hypothetical protein
MLKAALVPMAALKHLSCNHSGVLPRLFITGEYIAIRIRNRFPPSHDDIEKYRGIHREYPNKQKVAVRKRTLSYFVFAVGEFEPDKSGEQF